MSALVDWVERVRVSLKKENKERVLIWYDSIIQNGKVAWQSSINPNNL
jgi:endo-beta-N-acetylglucosaminidase D